MFEFIIGEIRKINEDYVILENHGMGYKIFTTEKAVEVVKLYEEYTFYISMQIRENEVYLYGFLDENELYLFNLLITVSGVGPKSGLSLLSVMNIYQIKQAVLMNDSNSLSKANGIGKKTAGRIILELQDKIINMDDDLIIGTQKELSVSENMLLAIDALQNLGFMRRDIEKVLMNVNVNAMEIEEIIKLCLKKLSVLVGSSGSGKSTILRARMSSMIVSSSKVNWRSALAGSSGAKPGYSPLRRARMIGKSVPASPSRRVITPLPCRPCAPEESHIVSLLPVWAARCATRLMERSASAELKPASTRVSSAFSIEVI